MDYESELRVQGVLGPREEALDVRRDYTLGLAEQEQPTGPLAAAREEAISAAPRGVYGGATEQPPEEAPPATPTATETTTTGAATEWERVYGAGRAPHQLLGKAATAARGASRRFAKFTEHAFGYEPTVPVPTSRSIAYDAEGRPYGSDGKLLELSNPYANMELPVLTEILKNLPSDAQVTEQIQQAIDALRGQSTMRK